MSGYEQEIVRKLGTIEKELSDINHNLWYLLFTIMMLGGSLVYWVHMYVSSVVPQ